MKRGALVFVVAAMFLASFVRLRLADVPLERDEGEYAYAGRLILEGTPPYEQAYNMKFPGTYYAYALIMAAFGESPRGIRTGLLVVNLASALLVFLIGRRLAGEGAAAAAAAAFLLLSLNQASQGVFGHATNFVVLPALAGFLFLLLAFESGRTLPLVAGGLGLGLAVLMKQHAIFFLPLGAVLVVWDALRGGRRAWGAAARRLGLLALASALPLAVVAVVLFAEGVFARFWFWTVRYAWAYVSEVPLAAARGYLIDGMEQAIGRNAPIWLLAIPGLLALWVGRYELPVKVFVTGLLASSFLAVCPGFYFRGQYFVLVLPAVALLSGIAVEAAGRLLAAKESAGRWAIPALLFAAAAALSIYPQRAFLFTMDPAVVSRDTYGGNPFPEAVEVARYIRERTGPEDRIAVFGSEPEIYFYAGRRSATGHIYTYGLMEPQPYASKMQQDMRREIEEAHPAFLVEVRVSTSWLIRKESDRSIFEWVGRYTKRCYDLVGVVDILAMDRTSYVWGEQAREYTPGSKHLLLVHRRKSAAPCAVGAPP